MTSLEPKTNSLIASLTALPEAERIAVLDSLSDADAAAILFDWSLWARPEQLPPAGDWSIWLILSGRGWGKTATGAHWSIEQARQHPHGALIGATTSDVRDTMILGESGILASSPPDFYPEYIPSKRLLRWPNGATALTYSAEKPDRLRGPNNYWAWCDELAAWRFQAAWEQLQFTLRGGQQPLTCVTTTPRPTPLIRELQASPQAVVVRRSTYDNMDNLAPSYIENVIRPIEQTRLGRQEVLGETLEDTPGALWNLKLIEDTRVTAAPNLIRIAVGVDPPASSEGAECGIVVEGLDSKGHLYVVADYSTRGTPNEWGAAAVRAYDDFKADVMVVEVNNGGDMVEHVIKSIDKAVNVKKVHASRGKLTRAEPISALYEQGKAHHVGVFAKLEDQKCTYVPGDDSPDRMDADVWAATELTTNIKKVMRFL